MAVERAYLWEFNKWLYGGPSYYNRKSSTNDEVPLDLSIKSTNTKKNLKTSCGQDQDVNNMYRAATNSTKSTSSEGNKRWTLRHREYAPGLIELIPNTGVFITDAELYHCLKYSRKCTQLARLLTKHIFTKAALKKCLYIGSYHTPERLQLDVKACAVIVDFALTYGLIRRWRPSSNISIRGAMRYQLVLSKKKSTK